MSNKLVKRILATALATTLVLGSTVTVFADGTAKEATGTGSFEGVEPELPAVTTVTLPAASATQYNFIADPAGMIRKYADDTTKANLPEAAKDKGIYFTVKDGKYSSDSLGIEVTNENARAIDLTVKLEVTGDYDDIAFAESGTWDEENKKNEMYLAAVEKADTPTNIAVVSAKKAAELKIKIDGNADNYKVNRTVDADTGKATYAYGLKAEADRTDWKKSEFYLTGAINKNAEWKDGTVTAPSIKVTWDYKAHTDAYLSSTTFSKTSNTATLSLPAGVTLSNIEIFKTGETTATATLIAGTNYTISGTTFTLNVDDYWLNHDLKTVVVNYSDNHKDTLTLQ